MSYNLRAEAIKLVREIKNNPEMLVGITPPREDSPAQLAQRPKAGEKIHNGKANFHRQIADMNAVELFIDLEEAIEWGDPREIAQSYFQLLYLVGH